MDILFEPALVSVPVHGEDAAVAVRRVYCVGRNYVAHIREMKEGDERDPPFFFQKPRDAIVPDGAQIPYPPATSDFHHEIELVVAIGRPGRDIAPGDALRHVFGYATGIDLTRRDRQYEARDMKRPWEVGKAFDHSAPCGPILRAEPGGAAPSGSISLLVNGETRQSASLDEMIWDVSETVAKLSALYALEPGDLVYTGTPAGVGPLAPGDVVEGRIDGLPGLSVTITEPAD